VCSALIKVGKRELVLTAARDDWTALFWAASSGLHAASLEMIAEGRKDLLIISDRRGQTALHRAAWRGGVENWMCFCARIQYRPLTLCPRAY